MKRTCDRCRALRCSQGSPFWCDFGYEIKLINHDIRPQQDCPKPVTYKDYIELKQNSIT